MFPFRAFQSAGSELETLPVKYLRWTLNTAGIPPFTPVVSSEFRFEGAEFSLELCKSEYYDGPLHGLYLRVKSAETPAKPVMVTAQVETEKSERIVTELSQETLVFTDTRIPKRIVWMKYDKEVVEADPEFSRTGILKLLVILKGRGAIPLTNASSLRPPSDSRTKTESSTDTKAAAPTEFLLNLTTGALSCLDNLPQDLAKHLDSDSDPNVGKGKTSSSSRTDS